MITWKMHLFLFNNGLKEFFEKASNIHSYDSWARSFSIINSFSRGKPIKAYRTFWIKSKRRKREKVSDNLKTLQNS